LGRLNLILAKTLQVINLFTFGIPDESFGDVALRDKASVPIVISGTPPPLLGLVLRLAPAPSISGDPGELELVPPPPEL
jgi:hypothetical protein